MTDSFGRPHANAARSLPWTTAWTVARRWRSTRKPSFADCFRELCSRTRTHTSEPLSSGVRSHTSVHLRVVVQWDWMSSWPKSCSMKLSRVHVGTSGPSSFFFSASSRSLRFRSFSSSFLRFSSALAAFFASLSLPPPSAGAPDAAGAVGAAGAPTVDDDAAAAPASPWKLRTVPHCCCRLTMPGSAAATSGEGHVGPPEMAAAES